MRNTSLACGLPARQMPCSSSQQNSNSEKEIYEISSRLIQLDHSRRPECMSPITHAGPGYNQAHAKIVANRRALDLSGGGGGWKLKLEAALAMPARAPLHILFQWRESPVTYAASRRAHRDRGPAPRGHNTAERVPRALCSRHRHEAVLFIGSASWSTIASTPSISLAITQPAHPSGAVGAPDDLLPVMCPYSMLHRWGGNCNQTWVHFWEPPRRLACSSGSPSSALHAQASRAAPTEKLFNEWHLTSRRNAEAKKLRPLSGQFIG